MRLQHPFGIVPVETSVPKPPKWWKLFTLLAIRSVGFSEVILLPIHRFLIIKSTVKETKRETQGRVQPHKILPSLRTKQR